MSGTQQDSQKGDEDDSSVSRRLFLVLIATIASGLASAFQLGDPSGSTRSLDSSTGTFGYGGTPVVNSSGSTLTATATAISTVTSTVSGTPTTTSTPNTTSTPTTTPTPTATPTETSSGSGGGGGGSGGGGGGSSSTPTPTSTSTADLRYGFQGYGEYGYGGVKT